MGNGWMQKLEGGRKLWSAAVVALVILGVAACGSSKSSSSNSGATSSSGGSSSSASEAANVKTACERVEEGTAPVTFKAPGSPVSGAALKGKTIAIVPITETGTVSEFDAEMKKAAQLVGATVTTAEPKGSIPAAEADVQQAIAGGASVIVDVAIEPALLKKSFEEAKAKGITVISVLDAQPEAANPPGVDGSVSWDYVRGGKLRADEAICATKGKLNLGYITSEDIAVGKLQLQGLKEELSALCPECKVSYANVDSAEWETGLETAASSLITREPQMNYFMPAFGAMVLDVLPTIQRLDPSGKIEVSSFDQEPSLIGDLTSGAIKADFGTSVGGLAWPTIDQALRILNHEKSVVEDAPMRVMTTAEANKIGLSPKKTAAENQKLVFGDFIEGKGYTELWGVE